MTLLLSLMSSNFLLIFNMSSSTLSFCTFPILCIFIVVNLSFSLLYISFRLTQASTCRNQGPLMSAKKIKPDQAPSMYVIFYKVHPKRHQNKKRLYLKGIGYCIVKQMTYFQQLTLYNHLLYYPSLL